MTLLTYPVPIVGPATKGFAEVTNVAGPEIARRRRRVRDLSPPVAVLDPDALAHNIVTMAALCREYGVRHAPHIKTTMAARIVQDQLAAGAFAVTVATAAQVRTAWSWGVARVVLANELLHGHDVRTLVTLLAADRDRRLWGFVDSVEGIQVMAQAMSGVAHDATSRYEVLIDIGAPGARTGVRSIEEAVALARTASEAGITVRGVAGYEGAVVSGSDAAALRGVAEYCTTLRSAASAVADHVPDGPVVVSAGGSAYLDVVLPELPGPLPGGRAVDVVVRSGAYVAHDHGMYAAGDPLTRMSGNARFRPAVTVLAQVVSAAERGLAILGAGRRDVPFDAGMPVPLSVRRDDGRGDAEPLKGTVTALNDQHAFLRTDATLRPGDLVELGISHPCSLFDRWQVLPAVRDDVVVDVIATQF